MSVCKQSEDTIKAVSKLKDDALDSLKKQAAEVGAEAVCGMKVQGIKSNNFVQKVTSSMQDYLNPAKSSRPDLVFFRNVLFLLAAVVIVYYALPRLSSSVSTGFSAAQFQKAAKLPESAFNIEEIAKVNGEVKAFQDHKTFFDDGGAYSYDNTGNREIGRTSVAMPMLVFFLQFVLPPVAIGYIIWFVLNYWKYVMAALWGWYIMLYTYFTNLIQGRLGCKWYIRWVTGWDCFTPNFAQYVINWRKRYIDGPIYQEKLKYIAQYRAAKLKYYTRPFKHYIGDPVERAKIRNEYAQKIAFDRTLEVMMKNARDTYDGSGALGSSSKVGKIYGSIFGRLQQSKEDLDDLRNGYESQTITGDQCTCPPVTTGLNIDVSLPSVSMGQFRACEAADRVINSRASVIGSIIVLLIAALIVIYFITLKFGTPVFVKNIVSQTTHWGPGGVKFKTTSYVPFFAVATTLAVLTAVGFY